MRIYLDACCYNRPFDDQTIARNRLESEAVLEILRRVQNGSVKLVQSSALEIELLQIPDVERRKRVQALLAIDSERVQAGTAEFARMELLTRLGVKPFDALHVACAESGRCDAFFTTDDRLFAEGTEYSSYNFDAQSITLVGERSGSR